MPRHLYLILAVCAVGLLVMLSSLRVLSDLGPEAGSHIDRRIISLERAVSSLQLIDNRMPTAQLRQLDMRPSTPSDARQHCPIGLQNLSSKQAMQHAGWQFDISQEAFADDEEHYGGHYSAWKDGEQTGKLKVIFNNSGKILLNLRNDHNSHTPRDVVTVYLNDEVLDVLRSKEERPVSASFQHGDVLKIEEQYGIIRVLGVSVSCEAALPLTEAILSRGEVCATGQKVHLLQPNCFRRSWSSARVQRVLDESTAAVLLDEAPATGDTSRYRVVPYSRLWLSKDSPGGAGTRCSSFHFKRERIGIVQVVDGLFLEKYKEHFKAQRCYARARGYEFWLLDIRSYPACDKYAPMGASMFFGKHCVVRSFLEMQEPGYVGIVIDADVVPAVLDRGVEQWLQTDADIHFYERLMFTEIAAGNYMIRNTPFAIKFLYEWSEKAFKIPKGYSSYDNGALHLHIIETLQLAGTQKCAQMYNELDVDMTTWHVLGQNLTTYFAYLRCAMSVLGPPRAWRIGGGAITIWPRGHFWVVDGVYLHKFASRSMGPVLHHGIKQKEELEKWYFTSLDRCELNAVQVLMDPPQFGDMILPLFEQYRVDYLHGDFCFQCTEECLHTLSCAPLAADAAPQPQFVSLP